MRVAFVEDVLRFSIPLGITSIAACLRQAGHPVAVFVVDGKLARTLDRLGEFRPDAVAFSVLSGSHRSYAAIAAAVRARLDVPLIWGGPHATFFPELVREPFADAVCVGEGEEAMVALADAFDGALPTSVRNFHVKKAGVVHENPVAPRLRKLDDFPWPARDLYYSQFPLLYRHGIKHFLAHRGCPYQCTYCFNAGYNRIYREQAGDKKVMASRSPDSIVDEILWTRSRVPLRMAAFVDDVFTLDRRWTLAFAETYARRCRLPFSINARFDNVDGEVVAALSDAGLRLVYAGVEAGSERVRNRVMKRRMSESAMYDAAALYRKHGVKLITENVLGAPGETFSEALETLRVNQRIRPELANASIFTPYPKLEMTEYAIQKGYFDGNFDRLNDNYYHGSVLRFDDEADATRVVNLRCFFSLLSRRPGLEPLLAPLLELPPNAVFRWVGDLIDGHALERCLPYRMSPGDFVRTLRHFLTSYRTSSSLASTLEARHSVVGAS
ncbi:MAG: radical SAM protein [Polyangiaceae bacterium]